MPVELLRFFESYKLGWDALSGSEIAAHYSMPTLVSDGDGLRTYSSEAELAAKFSANCQRFRTLGYRSAEFHVGHIVANGKNGATIDLGWRVALDSETVEFRTTYICTIIDGAWRILCAVAYEGAYCECDP